GNIQRVPPGIVSALVMRTSGRLRRASPAQSCGWAAGGGGGPSAARNGKAKAARRKKADIIPLHRSSAILADCSPSRQAFARSAARPQIENALGLALGAADLP